MLDALLATLHGAEPFQAAYGVSEAEARQRLSAQWRELDRLAHDDPAGYAAHLEAMARDAGVALPPGVVRRAAAAAAVPEPPASAPAPESQKAGVRPEPPPMSLLQQLATCARDVSSPGTGEAMGAQASGACTERVLAPRFAKAGGALPPRRPLIEELETPAPARPAAPPPSPQLRHQITIVRKQQAAEATLRVEVSGLARGLRCSDVAVLLDASQRALLVQLPQSGRGAAAAEGGAVCHRFALPAAVAAGSNCGGVRARLNSSKGQLVVRLGRVA
ncbi:hypothetical protein Rsub_08996 [Raphidocelis subcapitata]|uniref:Uncharacterized protein n=1 Tax=Raphidocelis subcapitata TaxID=307507 RepID=A0A2V0PAN4_9CHLO|nr:hypothetical protein Rsub_08996 [Raphidocelis subcapitata]|eukprot:GBF96916.1 hypothetical protein Rsub_08996 [Raphidocelis subcapitata]